VAITRAIRPLSNACHLRAYASTPAVATPSRRCRTTGAVAAILVPFPRPFVLNYFANASWFLTDFTPGTPRAISEALALAPIVAT